MNFTYRNVNSGTKLIKLYQDCQYKDYSVIYSIIQYDNVLRGVIELAGMPDVKCEEAMALTGENPVDEATSMLYWLEVAMKEAIEILMEQSA